MDQNLCRRLMPRPKFGGSHPTTSAAAPATSRSVHLHVVGREQMAVAADFGYRHGLEDTFQGKAHHLSFGCSKARPRYHANKNRGGTAVEWHRIYSQPAVELPGDLEYRNSAEERAEEWYVASSAFMRSPLCLVCEGRGDPP